MGLFVLQYDQTSYIQIRMLILHRETPVGYALFKAKSSKKLDGFIGEDDPVEDVVSKFVTYRYEIEALA